MEAVREGYFLNFLYIFIISAILFYYYICNKLNYWRRRGVPQLNNTSKIFGDFKNGILLRTSPGYHLSEIYREAPPDVPYLGFYILHKPCLLLKDPEIIKQIFIRDFNKFSDRRFGGSQQKDSSGMINLFGIKNPAWKYLRMKLTPSFTRSKLKQMLPFILECSHPMLEYIKKNTDDTDDNKAIIDAQDVGYRYTADLIANIALGFKSDSFKYPDSDYTKFFMRFFHSLKRMVAIMSVFFVPEFVAMISPAVMYDTTLIRKIFWSVLESREKSGEKRGDLIDTLIQFKNGEQDPIYKFEGNNLYAQSGHFISGLETNSNVFAFTLMELACNQNCQERARECVNSAIAKHGWSMESFNDMKYLDWCVAEGLRMHPSVPILDRCALEDYKIPNTDLIIERGTPIYVSLYGLHRDPQNFDRADTFDPERFNEDRTSSYPAYMPFGVGPRQCIGVKAGQLLVKVMLSKILSEYKVYQQPTKKLKLYKRATFTIAEDGIKLQFTKLIQ